MSLRAIDHIIVGVHDLAEAATIYTQRLGLTASGGGVHPQGGTANRIIVIGDTYLELIALQTPEEAQPSMIQRLAKGTGYVNFVLASDDIEADHAAMQERGITTIGPFAGSLQSVDGRERSWRRLDIERADMVQRYPFVLQHASRGEERRYQLAGWQNPPEHPLGVTSVLSVTIAVHNLAAAAQQYTHIYGLQPTQPFAGENSDGWLARLTAFVMGGGSQRFELAAPGVEEGEAGQFLPEPGALAHYLKHYGEGLCRMTLLVKDLTASCHYLDSTGVAYTYRDTIHPSVWLHPSSTCGASIVLREF